MTKDLKELADEIRQLRKEVRKLREAGGAHIHHHYAPLPVYVPQYPQPSWTPWWHYQTGTATPCGTSYTITNNAGDYAPTTTTSLPATAQISLT